MSITRRRFLGQATLTAAAIPLVAPVSEDVSEREPSGLATGKPRPLPYGELRGFLSKEQLRWHHESHYGGALSGFVSLDAQPTGSHWDRIVKANSVLLHELYFHNMTAKQGEPGEATSGALGRRFGSVERWVEDFRAAAKSCAGWAVLCWHPANGRLYNVVTESHVDGPAWSGIPIAVVDTYEHAYYLDFQNRKGDYVDAFTNHLDWTAVERRLRACLG